MSTSTICYDETADDWPRWEDEELHDGMRPMVCGDCWRPMLYDYNGDLYHHAVDADRGCFLIPDEQRADDLEHPLAAAWAWANLLAGGILR